MPPVGFEPTISAGERPQTYALDCEAIVTGTAQCLQKRIRKELCTGLSVRKLSLQFRKYHCLKCAGGRTRSSRIINFDTICGVWPSSRSSRFTSYEKYSGYRLDSVKCKHMNSDLSVLNTSTGGRGDISVIFSTGKICTKSCNMDFILIYYLSYFIGN